MEHKSTNWTKKRQELLDKLVEDGETQDTEKLRKMVHACVLVSSEPIDDKQKALLMPKKSVWGNEVTSWEEIEESVLDNNYVNVSMKSYNKMIKDTARVLKKGKASSKTLQAITIQSKKNKAKQGGAAAADFEEKKQKHNAAKKSSRKDSKEDYVPEEKKKIRSKNTTSRSGGLCDEPIEQQNVNEKMVLRKSTRDRTVTKDSAYYWTEPIAKQILAARTKKRSAGAQTTIDRPWTFAEIENAWRKDAYVYVKLPNLVAILKNQGLYKE